MTRYLTVEELLSRFLAPTCLFSMYAPFTSEQRRRLTHIALDDDSRPICAPATKDFHFVSSIADEEGVIVGTEMRHECAKCPIKSSWVSDSEKKHWIEILDERERVLDSR